MFAKITIPLVIREDEDDIRAVNLYGEPSEAA